MCHRRRRNKRREHLGVSRPYLNACLHHQHFQHISKTSSWNISKTSSFSVCCTVWTGPARISKHSQNVSEFFLKNCPVNSCKTCFPKKLQVLTNQKGSLYHVTIPESCDQNGSLHSIWILGSGENRAADRIMVATPMPWTTIH